MNVKLIWNFTVSGETVDRVELSFGTKKVAEKDSFRLRLFPVDNFPQRFNISADEPATLIILNVTEAEGGEYTCEVLTSASRIWQDKILVEVVGT